MDPNQKADARSVESIGELYDTKFAEGEDFEILHGSLLKLDCISDPVSKTLKFKNSGNLGMDEGEHESICSIFATTGSTIDIQAAQAY